MIQKHTKLPKKLKIKSKKRCNTQETLKLMLFVRLEQLRLQDSKLSDWKLSNRFFMCTKFLNSNKDKELYCIIGKIDLKKLIKC